MVTVLGRWAENGQTESLILVVTEDGEVRSNVSRAGARVQLALDEETPVQVEPPPAPLSAVAVTDPAAIVSFLAQQPEVEIDKVSPALPEPEVEPDEPGQPMLF
jgi:hypothetical protein